MMRARAEAPRQQLGLDGVRLALVEHDRDLAEVWTMLLEWLGAEVVPLEDAQVLVCDEAAAGTGVLAHASRARIPVVLLTSGLDRDSWLGSPRLVVLEKPVAPSVLVREVERLARQL
jgi:hypothetical protein